MTLVEMTLWGAAMIVVLGLARLFGLKTLPRMAMPWLWMVVLVRLLTPIQYTVAVSAKASELGSDGASELIPRAVETVTGAIGDAGRGLERMLAEGQAQAIPWKAIWLVGVACGACLFVGGHLVWRRRLREAVPLRHPAVAAWREAQPLCQPVRVLITARTPMPMACGILRPRIYIPAGMEPDALPYVLLHEGTHIQRMHLLAKLLMRVAICLHWFNPLVWGMASLLMRDLELACDARVLDRLDAKERSAYAHTLVSMAAGQPRTAGGFIAFTEHPVSERVRMMTRPPTRPWAGRFLTVALLLCCAIGFTVAQADQQEAAPPAAPAYHETAPPQADTPEPWP